MENMIFNELLFRGYNVDVGMVEVREKDKRILTEVDFICNKGNKKIYDRYRVILDELQKQKLIILDKQKTNRNKQGQFTKPFKILSVNEILF